MDFEFGLDINFVRAFSNSGVLIDYSTLELHTHSYDQILLIKNGISLFEDGKRIIPQYGNTAAFIPAGLPHRSKTLGKEIEYQSLYTHTDILHYHSNEIRIFSLSELTRSLFNKLSENNLMSLTYGIEGECLSLFIKLVRNDFNNINKFISLPKPSRTEIKAVIDFIHERYSDQISMKNITSVLPFSERHIARIFFKDMHITIINYLRMFRVFKASIEIQTSRKPISYIAYKCGYESISNFYRDFKSFFGITPKSFRKITSN